MSFRLILELQHYSPHSSLAISFSGVLIAAINWYSHTTVSNEGMGMIRGVLEWISHIGKSSQSPPRAGQSSQVIKEHRFVIQQHGLQDIFPLLQPSVI
mmetsp:Transcript_117145/g.203970  ORF Transcript_117145/g.203970 Transcript_117145/m.203970 type:complete len:98 (+) Transcript_117145:1767-2060(+)